MSANQDHKFDLDSTYFTAFEMSHRALKGGLKAASNLSISQYRLLAKLVQTLKKVNQGDLGDILGLKPNAMAQIVSALEQRGFVSRSVGRNDARQRYISATAAGRHHVADVNASLVRSLYTSFPTQNAAYATILEAAISAASQIEPPLNPRRAQRYPATRSLLSIDLIRSQTNTVLRQKTKASFDECRIVQRLYEVKNPQRVGVIADELLMTSAKVTRAVSSLVEKGWVRKMRSPLDKKAVFITLTEAGVEQGKLINQTVNHLAETYLWKHLNPQQKDAIEQVGHVVIAEMNAKRQLQEQANLELLQEI